MKTLILTLILIVFLFGCATPTKPLNTPSGRPEITIPADKCINNNVTIDKVRSHLSMGFLSSGWVITNESQNSITAEHADTQENQMKYDFFYGSRAVPIQSIIKLQIGFIENQDKSIRIVFSIYRVVSTYKKQETFDLSQSEDAHQLQRELEKMIR
jgi:hypothetical protein